MLADFGAASNFRLQHFPINTGARTTEVLPNTRRWPRCPPLVQRRRFADTPAALRALRVAAIAAQGSARSLGVVDDHERARSC